MEIGLDGESTLESEEEDHNDSEEEQYEDTYLFWAYRGHNLTVQIADAVFFPAQTNLLYELSKI